PTPTPAPESAMEMTVAPEESAAVPAPAVKAPPPRRVVIQDMMALAEEPDRAPPVRKSRTPAKFFGELVGGVRFLLGAALLAISLCWLYSRGMLPGAADGAAAASWKQLWTPGQTVKPLDVPLVPEVVLQALCSLGAAVAGLVLIASALWFSWRIGVMVLLAA